MREHLEEDEDQRGGDRAAGEQRDRARGWPMGAIALRLGVRLRKPGVYALNPTARSPVAADTGCAVRAATVAAWTALGAALLLVAIRTSP